jgi:TM2 domain-containing membrane protein YozV
MNDPANFSPSNAASQPEVAEQPQDTQRVGFCQDCGKPLTAATIRPVGGGVFCEPCLSARIGATGYTAGGTNGGGFKPSGTQANPATPPPPAGVPPAYPVVPPADARPGLAGLLGLIPGVGAMYNGQFAKGVVHVIIFAVLVSLANTIDVFGIFVAAWICYQAFEAYHTAKARLEGRPLPNPFGLNDIGERLGFGKNWGNSYPGSTAAWGAAPTQPPPPPSASNPTAAHPAGWQPVATPYGTTVPPQQPVPTGPDWLGYVPPTNFGYPPVPPTQAGYAAQPGYATQPGYSAQPSYATQPAPYAEQLRDDIQAQAVRDAGYPAQPYAPTFTGPSGAVPVPPAPRHTFPVGALWLIGLGVLILLANLLPDWRITNRWWLPILLAGLSLLIFLRRQQRGTPLLFMVRTPLILMTLAVLFALHAAYVAINFGLAFSVILIIFGVLLMMERAAAANTVYTPPVEPARASFVPAAEPFATAPTSAAAEPTAAPTAEEDSAR